MFDKNSFRGSQMHKIDEMQGVTPKATKYAKTPFGHPSGDKGSIGAAERLSFVDNQSVGRSVLDDRTQ